VPCRKIWPTLSSDCQGSCVTIDITEVIPANHPSLSAGPGRLLSIWSAGVHMLARPIVIPAEPALFRLLKRDTVSNMDG
jgi:hypothetical protein